MLREPKKETLSKHLNEVLWIFKVSWEALQGIKHAVVCWEMFKTDFQGKGN